MRRQPPIINTSRIEPRAGCKSADKSVYTVRDSVPSDEAHCKIQTA